MVPQLAIHVSKVSVQMVGVPVQWVVLGAQIIAWEVPSRVAQRVELVPKEATGTHRHRDYLHADW